MVMMMSVFFVYVIKREKNTHTLELMVPVKEKKIFTFLVSLLQKGSSRSFLLVICTFYVSSRDLLLNKYIHIFPLFITLSVNSPSFLITTCKQQTYCQ